MSDFLVYVEECCSRAITSNVVEHFGRNIKVVRKDKKPPLENIILSKLGMRWDANGNLVGDPAYRRLAVCFNPDLLGITDANRAMPTLRLLANKLNVFIMKPFQYLFEDRKFTSYKSPVDYLENTYGENWRESNFDRNKIRFYAASVKDELFMNFENNFWRLKSHSTDEVVDNIENIFNKQEIELKEYSAVTENLVNLWKLRNTPCVDGMTLQQKKILRDFFTTEKEEVVTLWLIASIHLPYSDLFAYIDDLPKISNINLMLPLMPDETSLKQHSSVKKSKLFDMIFKRNDIPLKKLSDYLFLNLDTIYIPLTIPFAHFGRDSFGRIYNRSVIKTIDYIKHCLNDTITDAIRMDLNTSVFYKNSLILYSEKARSFYAIGLLAKETDDDGAFKVKSLPFQLTEEEFKQTLDVLQDQEVLTYQYRGYSFDPEHLTIRFSNPHITISQALLSLGFVKKMPKEKFTFIGLDDKKITVDSFSSYIDKFIEHRLEFYRKRLDLEGLVDQSPVETWIEELDVLRAAVRDSNIDQHHEYFNKAFAKFNFYSLVN